MMFDKKDIQHEMHEDFVRGFTVILTHIPTGLKGKGIDFNREKAHKKAFDDLKVNVFANLLKKRNEL